MDPPDDEDVGPAPGARTDWLPRYSRETYRPDLWRDAWRDAWRGREARGSRGGAPRLSDHILGSADPRAPRGGGGADEEAAVRAAEQGNDRYLCLIWTPQSQWSARVCAAAAGNGRLGTLQWLRSLNPPCPWGAEVCAAAVRGGQHVVLKWILDQSPSCPWNPSECYGLTTDPEMRALIKGKKPAA